MGTVLHHSDSTEFLLPTELGNSTLNKPVARDNDRSSIIPAQVIQYSSSSSSLSSAESRRHDMRLIDSPPSDTDRPNFRLALTSIPAKSRVETQMKVRLAIFPKPEENKIHLPSDIIFRSRYRLDSLYEPKPGVLELDANVVCSSGAPKPVIMCSTCVRRERKRALRKKSCDKAEESLWEEGRIRRAVLFNCPEIIELTESEGIDPDTGVLSPCMAVFLPIRIACYCRHHSEKVGFRIILSVSNFNRTNTAMIQSTPVMITDDHKATNSTPSSIQASTDSSKLLQSENLSHMNSCSKPECGSSSASPDPEDGSNDNQTLPQFHIAQPTNPGRKSSGTFSAASSPGQYSAYSSPNHQSIITSPGAFPTASRTISSVSMTHQNSQIFSNRTDGSRHNSAGTLPYTKSIPTPDHMSYIKREIDQDVDEVMKEFLVEDLEGIIENKTDDVLALREPSITSPGSSIEPSVLENELFVSGDSFGADYLVLPSAEKLVPSSGSVRGGIEVTLLGKGFRPGLIVLFGDAPAPSTICWSESTMIAQLPPAASQGPVMVTFHGFPNDQPQVFTYVDDTDRQLMEVALRVVGYKMSGRIEDARNIAMRIVAAPDGTSYPMNGATQDGRSRCHNNGEPMTRQELETYLLKCIVLIDEDESEYPEEWNLTNAEGQSLLHLASWSGLSRLATALIGRNAKLDLQDRGGFTPLHFAALRGHRDIVQALIFRGADVNVRSFNNRSVKDMAADSVKDLVDAAIDVMHSNSRSHSCRSLMNATSRSYGSLPSVNARIVDEAWRHVGPSYVDDSDYDDDETSSSSEDDNIASPISLSFRGVQYQRHNKAKRLSFSRNSSLKVKEESSNGGETEDSTSSDGDESDMEYKSAARRIKEFSHFMQSFGDSAFKKMPKKLSPGMASNWQKYARQAYKDNAMYEGLMTTFHTLFSKGQYQKTSNADANGGLPPSYSDIYPAGTENQGPRDVKGAIEEDSEAEVLNKVMNDAKQSVLNDRMLLLFWLPLLVLVVSWLAVLAFDIDLLKTTARLSESLFGQSPNAWPSVINGPMVDT
ncbi:hypothetical protein CANCADRAFT_30083 [Tortispora caseinolytica NRRL Y-17796]|uniref:IPT/TIG domain-containing protein n=1 Tax=Tortispora caseinolytica NRRL Y-17796 TaxID=767744 RepID=A0A1E4TJ50_9ASCO|nr:hypothetical protein CANCADRAFT_30083 [Tortispora caseinolytica NRRL Y-17796]